MRRPPAFVLALALASPCVAAPALTSNVAVSSPSARSGSEPFTFKFGFQKGAGVEGRSSLGAGGGIKEGKPLEMALWGGGGAVAGSMTGPVGAMIGAAAGMVAGWIVATFVVPKNGPTPAKAL